MSDLVLSDLHKRFGSQTVLAGLDLTVPSGSFTALLGPSGVGKTTLLRLLAGFEAPDRGTISVGGRVLASDNVRVRPEQRKIGYVPQEGSLFPHLTVAANIGFGLPRSERQARAGELLEMIGLPELGRRYPHQLSGGQQQRVALARALAIRPEIVLLDEPFASLDANLRADLRDEVRRILALAGATALLVTHNQDEALSSADLVAVLRDGRIIQCATPPELYARPADGSLAEFVGDANLLRGVFAGGEVSTPLGRLAARWLGPAQTASCRVSVLIRPEQIAVRPAGGASVSGPAPEDAGQPVGRVLRVSFHGHDTVLQVEMGAQLDGSLLLVRAPGSSDLAVGDLCALSATGTVLAWPDAATLPPSAAAPAPVSAPSVSSAP